MELAGRKLDAHGLLRVLALGACVFFAVHGVHAGLRPIGSDFTIFYRAGEALLAGRDPTEVERFLYLPVFAVAFAPVALLPYAVALVLWQCASLVALVWLERRWATRCARELGVAPTWPGWLPLCACLRLIDSNLANGQANLLVLALVVAALEAWLTAHESRAGALLGAATALKILPAALFLVFLVRRGTRTVVAGVASVLVALLLPALVLGWDGNRVSLERWWHAEPLPYLRGGSTLLAAHAYLPGQSLTAVTYRLLAATPVTASGDEGPTAELCDLDPGTVAWIVRGIQAAALALLLASLHVSRRRAARGALLREIALAMCFALILGPLVHKAHMVWLLLPYALLLSGAPAGLSLGARRVRGLLIALSIAFVALTPPALLGRALATWALSRDAVFFGLLCVTGALLVDVWGASEASPERQSSGRGRA